MQTITYDLVTLLKRIKSHQFQIPQFQRSFKWKGAQMKLLVDSIARNYPIGSLLVLVKSSNLDLKAKTIDATILEEDGQEGSDKQDPSDTEVYFVLDGQQRLTSIARIFLDADGDRNFYFDLKSMTTDFGAESTNWIKSRTRSKSKVNPDRKDKNRLLRTDVVLDQAKTDIYVSEYIEDSGDFAGKDRNEMRSLSAKIKGYFETIRKYQIPVIVLDRETNTESICRVFETINSTGTKLTTFDLAVARFFPKPDLKELWENEAKEKFPLLSYFDVDGEKVLQVLALLDSHQKGVFSEPTRSRLLNLNKDFILHHWNDAVENLYAAYSWAKDSGARANTLSTHASLVTIAGFLMVYPKTLSAPKDNFRDKLMRWFYCSTLHGNRIATNYQIGKDFDELIGDFEKKRGLQYLSVNLTPEIILNLRGGASSYDNRFKALFSVITYSSGVDAFNGGELGEDCEDHHIFPRSLKTEGLKANRVNCKSTYDFQIDQ